MRIHNVPRKFYDEAPILEKAPYYVVKDIQIGEAKTGAIRVPVKFSLKQKTKPILKGTEMRPQQRVIRDYVVFEPTEPTTEVNYHGA